MRRSAIVVVLLAAAAFSVSVKYRLLEVASATTTLRIHDEAPAFALPDRNGTQFDLREIAKRNKVVLVNFWATWCTPCRIELPQLDRLYKEKSGRGLEILAISEDHDMDKLAEHLAAKPLSFPVLVDADGTVAKAYGVEAFPTSVLIGPDGRVQQIVSGLQPYLEALIEDALDRTPENG